MLKSSFASHKSLFQAYPIHCLGLILAFFVFMNCLTAYNEDTDCVGFAQLGSEDQMIVAGTMRQLMAVDFGAPLHCLVIVGKTHPLEEEMLNAYKLRRENLECKDDGSA